MIDIPLDRKLDAKIAQEIMRLKVFRVNLENEKRPRWAYCIEKNPIMEYSQECPEGYYHEDIFIPHYSSEVDKAFEVAEKVDLFKDHCLYKQSDGSWSIEKMGSNENKLIVSDTVARTICNAALELNKNRKD